MATTTETDIRALVESKRQDIEGLLAGSGLTMDRFASTLMQLWNSNKDLGQCTRDSILASILAVADMGLTFTPALGHAYIVKYGNTATAIVGYQGLMYMARRDGLVQDIRVGVRREDDQFAYNPLNTTEPIRHIPADPPTGNVLGYYCVAYLSNGFVHGYYMSKQQVDKYKADFSPSAGRQGPWSKSPDAYGIKTVVRQNLKFLQLGGKVSQAYAMGGEQETVPNVSVEVTSAAGDLDNPLPQLAEPEVVSNDEAEPTISTDMINSIMKVAKSTGWKINDLCSLCSAEYGVDSVEDLTAAQAPAFMTRLEQRP